jgi:hypothetical protein
MNNAAINTGVQVFMEDLFSILWDILLISGTAGSYDNSIFYAYLLRNPILLLSYVFI